jgi:hypothetical protein
MRFLMGFFYVRSVMAKKMRVVWACDTPGCNTTQESTDEGYGGHEPPEGWALLNLNVSVEECACECHEYSYDIDEDDDPSKHEEEDCTTCPPEGSEGQITICPRCTSAVQATYYVTRKGALL